MYSTEEEPQPIAIVSLQMEEGMEEIKVYEGEDVELAVELFCQRYGLGNDCTQYLVDQINKQLKREPSPRFGDNLAHKLSFGQKGPLQPSESKQSDVGITTQASSVDENQPTGQKSYEQWQRKINQKLEKPQGSTIQWTVPNSTRSNISKGIIPAERLYREGMDQQRIKQEKADYFKLQKTRIEDLQATFKPTISPRSRQMANLKRPNQSDNLNIGQQLYQKGIDMNIKKEGQIKQFQDEQKKLSPFQPRRQLDSSRNHSNHNRSANRSQNRSITPIYEKLFLQGKDDQKKKDQFIKDEFLKKHPFHPQTNTHKQNNEVQDQQKYVQMLFKQQEERKKIQDQKQREMSIQNQSSFQPSITKDNTYRKVSKRKDYEDNQLVNDLQQMKQKVNNKNSFCSISKPNSRQQSDVNIKSQFELNVQKIFNQLDGDRDGWISKEKLNLSGIDVQLLELVSEALYKIEEEDIVADQNYFKNICQTMGLASKLNKQFMQL